MSDLAAIRLLPGWATDARIFGGLPQVLGEGTLLGWSLGGFRAVAYARAHPERVRCLILVGIRQHYPADAIAAMRAALHADPQACLTTFYRQCFLPGQKDDFRCFRAAIMPAYLQACDIGRLDAELVELGGYRLSPADRPPCPVTLIHGRHDIIAPSDEARELAAGWECPLVEFDAAHAVCRAQVFHTWLGEETVRH